MLKINKEMRFKSGFNYSLSTYKGYIATSSDLQRKQKWL